ncbi:MAG TPA: DHH family phosphoesterase [Candidatus Saccharimonadales bacterium]|nr:DHH family phosphoesterase [Candidatus Saccharimonadales bacterium]
MEYKLLKIINESQRIFITSHISPDPDAITSVLLLGATLRKSYPDKQVETVLDEEPTTDIQMLGGYNNIAFGSAYDQLVRLKPDLFIMLDVANFSRISRDEGPRIKSFIKDVDAKTVIIDHHEETGRDDADLYINEHLPATVQQVYKTAFTGLKLSKPDGYAETTMLGILSDTNRFKYQNPHHRETFELVSDLIDAGARIEKLEYAAERYSRDDLAVLAEFLKNIKEDPLGYTYSYLNDDFINQRRADSRPFSAIKNGSDLFVNNYIRNVGDSLWGFSLYKEYLSGENMYSARLRAVEGSGDMSQLAAKLGGGGHKGAAGAKFEASNLQAALRKVQDAIRQSA